MAVERELKLTAGPGFHLPELGAVMPAVQAAADTTRMETTYYDTDDLDLARWGCSLRYRSREGWTVKLPRPERGEVLERDELHFKGPASTPPRAALKVIRAYQRHRKLEPVARLSTLRHRVRLSDKAGKLLAEVVDDEVSVLDGRRVASRFREVEIELKEGDATLLAAVVKRLRAAGARRGEATPKHVRALGPKATAPPEVAPAPLSRQPAAGELVGNAIRSAVAALLTHDPGVRLGSDPEAVHQARVAVRTLRSHLRTFAVLLEGETPPSDRLRDLGRRLGEVRDGEVLLDLLRSKIGELPADDRPAAEGTIENLQAEIDSARTRLAAFMDREAYLDLLDSLVVLARAPAFNELARLPAAKIAVELASRPWRRLRKAVQSLPDSPEPDQLHRIRILAKRTRYAAEAVVPVAGRRAERFAETAEALQSVLGEYRDAITAEGWLRSHAGTGRRAFVTGELASSMRSRAGWMRSRWRPAWDSLRRKRLREWFNR